MTTEAKQRRLIRLALERMEPKIRQAFEEAIARATNRINLSALLEAIDARNIDRVLNLIELTDADMTPLREALQEAFKAGGTVSEGVMPKSAPLGVFYFNTGHERAEAWVRQWVGNKIQGIQLDTLALAREVVESGISEGLSSLEVARSITGTKTGNRRVGGFLGLNSQQAGSIIRSRGLLASGDPDLMAQYLDLKLRDRRFDKRVKAAIAAGKPIKGKALTEILEAHRNKALGYRGRVIAKNEARNALHAGNAEGMRQILERPDVETVTKRWIHGLSKEPRPDHVAMNGTVVGIGEQFEVGGVMMDRPHDPNAPAEHTIGCNCSLFYRVKFRVI